MKVLVVGSHIDDIEIGCGGTLIKHRDAGDEITLGITHADDKLSGDLCTRLLEQSESIKVLGAKGTILCNAQETLHKKVARMDSVNPDILYFPFENDHHQDHLETAKVGFAVARRVEITVLRYITPTSHSYFPNYLSVVDIGKKVELVSVFKSQMARRPKFMEVMVAQNRFFGSLIPGDGHHAEGFMLFRMVKF